MTFDQLRIKLQDSMLFDPCEITDIINCCGEATMGTAVIACELLGMELHGSDIDAMFSL